MKIVPPTPENLNEASLLIKQGKLVGMPTETVYGIAANALDTGAVAATFAAKGRPAENPLIVHVANFEMIRQVAREFPDEAKVLGTKFWPGPMTLVLPKHPDVPSMVTAGLETVAIRIPAHPVARELIEKAGVPISAPSANLFTSLSPTTAHMIDPHIGLHLSMILDGGPCEVGIESTVIDLTESPPRILRPGGISKERVEEALGASVQVGESKVRRSPGMYAKHYAPKATAKIVDKLRPGQAGLTLEKPNGPNQVVMSNNPAGYAKEMYQALNDLDHMRIGTIYIQAPPRTSDWDAVWDRLNKLSSP